jgi:Fe-S cluster assembly ATP-binding protein
MKINNLTVKKGGKDILKNLTGEFVKGQIHIIMGPNGSGKSTLSYSIAGHPDCEVISGTVDYEQQDILQKDVHERGIAGIYLAPQYPPAIPGLSHAALLKESINVRRQAKGDEPIDEFELLKLLRNKAQEYQFDSKTYPRQSFNEGFSGGEKKRNEILQISLLNPDFIILDEIDSGLDIEAMKRIASFIKNYLDENKTIVVITHYPQFAELIEANQVHILKNGHIVHTGDKSLVSEISEHGFGRF